MGIAPEPCTPSRVPSSCALRSAGQHPYADGCAPAAATVIGCACGDDTSGFIEETDGLRSCAQCRLSVAYDQEFRIDPLGSIKIKHSRQ